jgi:hypothetical protein
MDQIATPFCRAKSGLDLANFPRFDLHYKERVLHLLRSTRIRIDDVAEIAFHDAIPILWQIMPGCGMLGRELGDDLGPSRLS